MNTGIRVPDNQIEIEIEIEIEAQNHTLVSRLKRIAVPFTLVCSIFLFVLVAVNSQPHFDETQELAFHSCFDEYKESTSKCNFKQDPVNFGYDVVSYWSLEDDEPAVEGSQLYKSEYNGYKFRFSSQENKDTFDFDPEKYLPAWGGYCAYGIAAEIAQQTELFSVKSDPNQWEIIDERLFLFRGEGAKELFVASKDDLISVGDALWERWFNGCFGFFFTNCITS